MNTPNDRFPTLIDLNDSAAPYTVFCVHTVGGGLGAYRHLAARLRGTARIYGLEDPSIYANDTFSSVPELAELHVETICQVQPQRPYLLFGACSAGPIAYEIACQLSLQGEDVERIVMFGAQNDLVAYDPGFKDPYQFLHSYLTDNLRLDVGAIDWSTLASLDRRAGCSAIVGALVSRNTVLQDVDADALQQKIASMLTTQTATRCYRAPKSFLDIDLFTHPIGDTHEMRGIESWCDWTTLTSGTITHIDIDRQNGAGAGVLSEPYIDTVVDRLRQTIFSNTRTSKPCADGKYS